MNPKKTLSQFIEELLVLEAEYGDVNVFIDANGEMQTPDATPVHGGTYDNFIVISWT